MKLVIAIIEAGDDIDLPEALAILETYGSFTVQLDEGQRVTISATAGHDNESRVKEGLVRSTAKNMGFQLVNVEVRDFSQKPELI